MTNTTKTEEGKPKLLPCPFCGETLVEAKDFSEPYFQHKDVTGPCMISVVLVFDDEVGSWNKRATEAMNASPSPALSHSSESDSGSALGVGREKA